MSIAERIRYWREKKKLSRADLAALIGVTPEAVIQWERGTIKNPRFTHLEKLAEVLDISTDTFWAPVRRARKAS